MKTLPTLTEARNRLISQGIPSTLVNDLTGVTSTRFAGFIEWGYIAHSETGGVWCLALCKYYPQSKPKESFDKI